MLGRGEQSIYTIHLECKMRFPDLCVAPIIADVRDRNRMRQVFETHRPHAVFHTAAHKHVELIEAFPEEVVKNNILGTRNISELAHEPELSLKRSCFFWKSSHQNEFLFRQFQCLWISVYIEMNPEKTTATNAYFTSIFYDHAHQYRAAETKLHAISNPNTSSPAVPAYHIFLFVHRALTRVECLK